MSYASMKGQSMYIGSTIGTGELRFSDGTVQTTAYTASANPDDGTSLTLADLTVTDTATIETAYIGSNSSTSGLVVYGLVQQVLSGDYCTQYGSNSLTSNTGLNNTAFGSSCMSTNTTGSYNTGLGDYALTLIQLEFTILQ